MEFCCSNGCFFSLKSTYSHLRRLFCTWIPSYLKQESGDGLVKRLRNSSKVFLSALVNKRNAIKYIKGNQDIFG